MPSPLEEVAFLVESPLVEKKMKKNFSQELPMDEPWNCSIIAVPQPDIYPGQLVNYV